VPNVVFLTFLRDGTTPAPYFTAGGAGTTSIPTRAGSSAAFVRDPRVRVQATMGSGEVLRGTLYIQRQHTIEV
jgi:hypothetical protein